MEIGKYIGKFLLKNKYCSLPGLGVFELKKASASYGNSNQEIENPSYIISFTPVGSIDDTFASFIASYENVSISNASNNIKEYCKTVKEQVAKVGSFDIEHLGKVSNVNGKLAFKQSSDLDLGYSPAPVPAIEVAKQSTVSTDSSPTDYSYPPAQSSYARKNKNAWMKYVAALAVLGLIGAVGFLGYKYYKNSQTTIVEPAAEETAVIQTDTTALLIDSSLTSNTSSLDTNRLDTANTAVTRVDSVSTRPAPTTPTSAPTASTPTTSGTAYNLVIMSSRDEGTAKAKAAKLSSYGHNAQVINKGGEFLVTLAAAHPSNDTTVLVDSIRRFFNPKGKVYILK